MLLVLITKMAMATEVGAVRPVGMGISTGYPGAITITGKYWFGEKAGIAGYIGTMGITHGLRALYQHEFYPINEWEIGRMPLYWMAGVDASITKRSDGVTDSSYHPRIGLVGGAGIEMQFSKVPAEVFFEMGPAFYPINGCSFLYGHCFFGAWSQVGARWYF